MSAKETLVLPPEKELVMPSVDDSFTLSAEDFQDLKEAAQTLSSPNIGIVSDGENIEIISFSRLKSFKSRNLNKSTELDSIKQIRI